MESIAAFARGAANRGKEQMVFDWRKAVDLINEHGYKNCGAGLESDFEYTLGQILSDGKPVTDDYHYLASTWAKPQLVVYSEDGFSTEAIDCFIMASQTTWDCSTKFPEDQQKRLK